MSVQAGIWNFDGEPVDRGFLAKVSSSLSEFGPDGESFYMNGEWGTVYRPFCTTAESRLERQPFVSHSGRVITWDGRLDNREELISLLSDDIGYDRTDVAIVACAFERWGTHCFGRIIGDWALAIWTPKDRELILARDYIGVKHLFYYATPKTLAWCS